MSNDLACQSCGLATWTDAISTSEIVLLHFTDGTFTREGRKYNEEREQVWVCPNNHLPTADQYNQIEALYARHEGLEDD